MGARKYYLDWLRIIAFGLLILFHTGMLYVSWPYNLKSPRLVPEVEWAMNTLGPWRMPLLFVISGVASRFLIERLGPGAFAFNRLKRFLPVILVGMFVVIPPQTYVELVTKIGLRMSYLDFWLGPYLHADQTLVQPLHKTMPTWDHLWFLVYLLAYALIFAAGFVLVHRRREPDPVGNDKTPWGLLIFPALWMAGCNVIMATVAPFTHAFATDWGAHLKWLGLYLIGVHMATQNGVWDSLQAWRRRLFSFAVVLLAMQMLAIWAVPLEHDHQPIGEVLIRAIPDGLYGWSMVLAVIGYAARYLDRPSAALTYLNGAILPIYVLHQPILLVAAFFTFPLGLPLPVEAAALVSVTGFGPFVLYSLMIRPFAPMRFLFGVKIAARHPAK